MTKTALDILGLYALTLGTLLTQKRTQIALSEQRNLLRTLIDNMPDYIYIKDLKSRFVLVNQAMLNATALGELIGKSDIDIHSPELAEAFFADEQALLQSGQALINKEEWVIGQQGNRIYFLTTKIPLRDVHGQIIGLLGAGRDITERKQVEAALVEQRNLLQTLIDNLPEYIYVKDLKSRFVLVNKAMLDGTPKGEMIGKSDFDFQPLELAQAFFAEEQALLQSGEAVINKEQWLIDAQGNKTYYLTTKIPLRDIHGQIIGLLGSGRNITERKKAEQQAQELDKEREQVKMLSDFIQNISHDFRTPLTIISSSLYFLERLTDPEKRKKHYENAEQQISHLTQLIDRLLLMSRLDSKKVLAFERVDINPLVADLCNKIGFKARQKVITVISSLWKSSLMVQVDPQEFSLALNELGENALMYTPANGKIEIRTKQQNDQVVIEVCDSGIGIPSAELSLIFERLYRVDKARALSTGGAGLGLSIAKRIIELHHGTIVVESVLDIGSTFKILLPIAP